MFNHFLVPISGEIITKKTLKEVARLAGQTHAQITLAYISDPLAPYVYMEGASSYAVSDSTHKKACAEYAERLFSKAQAKLGADLVVKTCHLFDPNVFAGIILAAKKSKADVIVMASHRRKGLKGIFLGSDTHAVITHTTLPVLVL
jgi:nucleotide-binding universal stress UspA family protein